MMPDGHFCPALPDAAARRRALLDHDAALLVEAGAGSGKTALMAGRVAMMLEHGIRPRDIVAITFTEAAAAELLERIERFVTCLAAGTVPPDLQCALPVGLPADQRAAIAAAATALDEITCTTIHGFCQQLIKPYPIEAGIDPGAAIIDPAAADLAYQDLMRAWLSARFGRARDDDALGRIPQITNLRSEDDFFAEILAIAPDQVVALIADAANFLRTKRTARAPQVELDTDNLRRLSRTIIAFTDWYIGCGITEPATAECVADLAQLRVMLDETLSTPITGRVIARLLLHAPPDCRHGSEVRFKVWQNKGKWHAAACQAGYGKARGEQLSAAAKAAYDRCSDAYESFSANIAAAALSRFVSEFEALRSLYADYKRQAALLDFDDLLHHARDLLVRDPGVRQVLARRYPRVLVDEFQDTDPLQAEILWLLCGEGTQNLPWIARRLRPGSLFLVGDPKQAIYRFRGADVDTYLEAKRALLAQDPDSIIEITANFRSRAPILDFANDRFQPLLSEAAGQPGFTPLAAARVASPDGHAVACFEIPIDDRHKDTKGRLDAELVREEEALIVAQIVQRLIGNYQIWDKRSQTMRVCRAGDIALLAPTGASLWRYERALEFRHVPVASQAGKGFFRRQEIQDLIALSRTIADRRDTLGFGAFLRGPLVGLSEEEIADAIAALPARQDGPAPRLHLWTDRTAIAHPLLGRTLEVLQNLARKARRTTPYQIIAEAIEELNIRPILRSRYRLAPERALANVELFLEMARAYDGRGLTAFALAMRHNWEDAEAQVEGRPDAEAESVSIITMHLAKGLEWPVVIPINSPTELYDDTTFLHRRSDDTVHFKLLDQAPPDYELVKTAERDQLRRERVRLWYVAITRACDLLLLPRQSERKGNDWMSIVDLRLDELPTFDPRAIVYAPDLPEIEEPHNTQDETTWRNEAAIIVAARRSIVWRSPSRHEMPFDAPTPPARDEIFADPAEPTEQLPPRNAQVASAVRGSRERGLIVHKLLEEVLTGETPDQAQALETRARALLLQLGTPEAARPEEGPHAPELAATTLRALAISEIAACRASLLPEVTVFSAQTSDDRSVYVGGVADAVAYGETGIIDLVIDWKTDVAPSLFQIGLYREQLHDYLVATGAAEGLLVFVTTGQLVWVRTKFRQMPASGAADLHLASKSSISTASPRRQTRSGQYEFSF
ncbi:MAG TPA: UvrD-helicase domain-containing protein [Stellaceae bacterium]